MHELISVSLVKYSREQRELGRTGTDDIPVKVFSATDVINDHYNQSRSYIERIQAVIPGMTARKIALTQNKQEFSHLCRW